MFANERSRTNGAQETERDQVRVYALGRSPVGAGLTARVPTPATPSRRLRWNGTVVAAASGVGATRGHRRRRGGRPIAGYVGNDLRYWLSLSPGDGGQSERLWSIEPLI